MAINLATKYSSKVDEVFRREALTGAVTNAARYDFIGAQTVKVYGMGTAKMNDYKSEGTNRYGTPEELQDTTEELTLSQKRSFTFTIDRTNAVDSPEGVRDAAAALRRQIDQVVIPEIDTYRLGKAAEKAGTIAYGEISNGAAYSAFIDANQALTDAEVPIENRIAFVSGSFLNQIKQDDGFVKASEIAQGMLIKGQVGEIDGVRILNTPKTRLPLGVSFIIMHAEAMTSPTKLAEYRIHADPPGLAGHLVEGLVYYDAFITANKKPGVTVRFSSLGAIPLTMTAGETGKGVLNVGARNYAGKLQYKTGASVTLPTLGSAPGSGWTDVPEDGIISATSGQKVAVVAVIDGKATAASEAITVSVGA